MLGFFFIPEVYRSRTLPPDGIFSLHRALLQAQGEAVGEHGDELGIRRLALDV